MIESGVCFLPVEDLEKTTEFYTRIIGLALWKDFGSCRIFDCGGGYFGFCAYGDGREHPKGVCLSLNLPDVSAVDREYARVKALLPHTEPPEKHPNFPVYSFFLQDPEGYTVEFQKILA